jgi:hypothetical protein
MITALKGQMQTGFGDINTRFDDLTFMLEMTGLRRDMNWGRREARVRDEARN